MTKIIPDSKWLTKNSKELGKILDKLPTNIFLPDDDEELDSITDDVDMESSYTDEANAAEVDKCIKSLLIPSNQYVQNKNKNN